MATLADKINFLLEERGLMKRDLARALEISPQTATDICKGRSAITLPHLRNLIRFFGLRADYWMDEERLEPADIDEFVPRLNDKFHAIAKTRLLHLEDPAGFVDRLIRLASRHRDEYARTYGPLGTDERDLLGIPSKIGGMVGRIQSGETN
jgi:transcriptional regulator with XRE-family HTH domain